MTPAGEIASVPCGQSSGAKRGRCGAEAPPRLLLVPLHFHQRLQGKQPITRRLCSAEGGRHITGGAQNKMKQYLSEPQSVNFRKSFSSSRRSGAKACSSRPVFRAGASACGGVPRGGGGHKSDRSP